MKPIHMPALICGGALALSLGVAASPSHAAEPVKTAPAPMNTTKAVDALSATQWKLISPAYAGLTDAPTLEFNEERISASVGLNRLGAGYSAQGQNLKFTQLFSTKMAGSPALMKAETDYSQALQSVRSFQLSPDGETLTLRGAQTLTFARAGVVQTDSLANTEWIANAPGLGLPGIITNKSRAIKFTDKTISTSVGLNRINGNYKTAASKINISGLASTKMAGPPDLMKAENDYIRTLEGAADYEISPDGQTLTLRGAQTLTFAFQGRNAQGFAPAETKIINVEPQLGPQMDGDQTPKYLQLEDLSEGVSWGKFTEPQIIGFDYQPGNRYQLRVQVERDARSGEKQLRLLEVFSQHYVGAAKLDEGDVILEVAPNKVDCVGVAPMKCLQVRKTGGAWENFYAPIEGFDFREGWRYRLQVKVSQVANPPADGSSLRYQLVRVLDKTPVTY